jgi:predicted CxxxxCH...CXXCH cytochrome family protein
VAYGSTIDTEITVEEGILIDLTATVSDGDTSHTISAAEYFLDTVGSDGTGTAMDAVDGTFNSASEDVEDPATPGQIDTSGWSAGEHKLYVHGQDDDGWGPVSYATVNITAAPAQDDVTLSASNLASGNATQGAAYSFLKLDFTVNTVGDSEAVIDRIQVNRAGSAADADVSQVAIYEDTDTSGDWNTGDVLLGTGTFSTSAVDIDITDQTVTNPSTTTVLVVMTMASGATTGNNIGATITDQNSITLVSPDTMNTYGGIISTLMNIVSEGGGGIACTDCHGSWPQTSGAHGTHNADTDPEVNDTPCEPCHGDLAGYTSSHGNGELDFTFTGDVGSTASYSSTAPGVVDGTCSGVDCHYENITPAWNTSGLLTCNSCHDNSALPDKHTVHLNSSSLPDSTNENECYVCHNTSADNTGSTLANHGNKVKNVDFNSGYQYEGGTPSRANTGAATTCSAILCHNGAGTPAWNGTVTCGSCHGSGGPLPTGTTAGSHTAGATTSHGNNDADYTDCARCHSNANNYKATKAAGDPAEHKNLTVNMGGTRLTSYTDGDGSAGIVYSGDFTDDGTCDTNCHGMNTPTWGAAGTVVCGTCHGTEALYADNRDGHPPSDLAGGANAVKVGKHSQHMNESMSKSGSYCGLCHNGAGYGTGSHPDGTVDVVLDLTAAGGSATRTDNDPGADSCNNLTCHQDTTWNSAVTGGCAFCHSYPPTGTGGSTDHTATNGYGNIDSAARLLAAHQDCAICHGVAAATPGDPNSGWGTPKDETSKSGDAYSIGDHHRDGNVQMNGISDPNNNQSTEYNEVTTGCGAACHTVDAVFDGTVQTNTVMLLELGAGGCDLCHGGTSGTDANTYWPDDGATTDSAGSRDNDGLHTSHMTLLAARHYTETIAELLTNSGTTADVKQKTLCEYCHAALTNDDGHGGGEGNEDDADVFVTNMSSVATTFAKHLDQSTDGDAAYSGGSCSAVDCHNNTSVSVA